MPAKAVSDHKHKELHPDEIFNLFKQTFENVGQNRTASMKYISSRKMAVL